MNKEELIKVSKQFRKDADDLLQRMKHHTRDLKVSGAALAAADGGEVIAQHILSQRDLESCIMRMGVKNIGVTNPYPESKNPDSPVVHPTSGVKL